MTNESALKKYIRTIPDYPKPGVMFGDITTLLKDPVGFNHLIEQLCNIIDLTGMDIDIIVGIESRGFIIGAPLAIKFGTGFVPIRKKGKLPGPIIHTEYTLEYGIAEIEIHKDAIKQYDHVLVVDDVCATGGTTQAACSLVEQLGGQVVGCLFAIDLPDLGGSNKLKGLGYPVYSVMEFREE